MRLKVSPFGLTFAAAIKPDAAARKGGLHLGHDRHPDEVDAFAFRSRPSEEQNNRSDAAPIIIELGRVFTLLMSALACESSTAGLETLAASPISVPGNTSQVRRTSTHT